MSRTQRADEAGGLYHVMNRGNMGAEIFLDDQDFEGFELIISDCLSRFDIQMFAYQLLPTHWHLVLLPNQDGELSRFVRSLSTMHSTRFRARYRTTGEGHVYQGNFKSFPTQADAHFLTVCRYVEQNAWRAKLVKNPEKWRWGSLWRWLQIPEPTPTLLSPWPIRRQARWAERVKTRLTVKELESVRESVKRGRPFGDPDWVESTVARMGLESTVRTRGRPRVVKSDTDES